MCVCCIVCVLCVVCGVCVCVVCVCVCCVCVCHSYTLLAQIEDRKRSILCARVWKLSKGFSEWSPLHCYNAMDTD